MKQVIFFWKTFKGNLSRIKPAQRGVINRTMNKGIDKVNDKIGSGDIITNAAVNGKTAITDKTEWISHPSLD